MKNYQRPIAVLGATASGKSDFAIELALRIGGEIISCDSMQVYKGLDIGTGKVGVHQRELVAHHLLDIIEPNEQFSAGEFKRLCEQKLDEIGQRGKRALLAGGTGLFIKGLKEGHSFAFAKNEELRQQLGKLTNQQLMDQVKEIDPQTMLHLNDRFRLIRALEIYKISGKTKAELAQIDSQSPKKDILLLGLGLPRDVLYSRINARVEKMLENGLEDEVRSLMRFKDCQSMRAIGYKEFFDYFEGRADYKTTIEKIKQGTRNYAKRQLTFFRAIKDIVWLDAQLGFEQNLERIKDLL